MPCEAACAEVRMRSACVFAAVAAAPQAVLVDTDVGTDMDDTWALALLAQRPT